MENPNGESDDENRCILQDQQDEENREDSGNHSSLPEASYNFINSIIGSGIIGMSYAIAQAGILLGLLIIILLAMITDYSLIMLIKAGQLSGTSSYQGVMTAAFGTPGFVLLSMVQFIYPFIAMVSYNVIVGDTLTKVIIFYGQLEATSAWARRELVITFVMIFVLLPLSLCRSMTKFSRISLASLLFTAFILIAICIRMFTLTPSIPKSPDAWNLSGPGITEAFAITSFAFMCHHSTFLIYGSLKPPNQKRWKQLTHISVSLSAVVEILFGIFGYITFTGYVQGDLLENYCYGDHLMNAARVVFSITILLTYPIESFVARDVILSTLLGIDETNGHRTPEIAKKSLVVTAVLTVSTSLMSFTTDCLGMVLELNGILAAIPLAYILPSLCYLRLEPSPWRSRNKLPAVMLAAFGICTAVISMYFFVVNWGPNSTCSHGVEMFYCSPKNATPVEKSKRIY